MRSCEHIDSHHARTAPPEEPRPGLRGRVDAEVAIIGGGLAGLSAALSLIERGVCNVVVLEARRLGWGASGRNAGHVSPGFALDPWSLEEQVGREHGRRLFALTREAARLICARIDRYGISCARQECGGVQVWWTPDLDEAKRQQECMTEVHELRCDLWPAERTRAVLRSSRYHHALYCPEVLQLQPLSYVRGLARQIEKGGARIYEGTEVHSIETREGRALIQTSHGEVRARHVLCAGGGYLRELLPEVSRAVVPLFTHVLATAPLGERLADAIRVPHSVCDSRTDHDYYSTLPGGRLLFGGGVSIFPSTPRRVAERLQKRLLAVYPQLRDVVQIESAWSGLIEYARHFMPMIGQTRNGIWYSAGHGGQGLVTTVLHGELFARALVDGDDTYRLFAPFRLEWTGGFAGRAAAQLMYWYYQGVDLYRSRIGI